MDLLKHDTVSVGGHTFHLRELTARAMLEISTAEQAEIPGIVVRHGVEEFKDSEDPATEMPFELLTDLAAAVFELSGLNEDEGKKPSPHLSVSSSD